MNLAYKHLDAKLRIAELSVGQWIGVLLGLGVGIAWGVYVSPFGSTVTLITAVYFGALPAGAAFAGNITEVSPWLVLRSALDWRRREGRYVPGPGRSAHGYLVTNAAAHERAHAPRPAEADLATLWGEAR